MNDAPLPQDHRDGPPPDTSVKVTHLVFALLFLGTAGIWALARTGVVTADRLTVVAPALLIAAGVIGLVASLASGRNRRRRPSSAPLHHDPHDAATDDRDDTEPTQEIR